MTNIEATIISTAATILALAFIFYAHALARRVRDLNHQVSRLTGKYCWQCGTPLDGTSRVYRAGQPAMCRRCDDARQADAKACTSSFMMVDPLKQEHSGPTCPGCGAQLAFNNGHRCMYACGTWEASIGEPTRTVTCRQREKENHAWLMKMASKLNSESRPKPIHCLRCSKDITHDNQGHLDGSTYCMPCYNEMLKIRRMTQPRDTPGMGQDPPADPKRDIV